MTFIGPAPASPPRSLPPALTKPPRLNVPAGGSVESQIAYLRAHIRRKIAYSRTGARFFGTLARFDPPHRLENRAMAAFFDRQCDELGDMLGRCPPSGGSESAQL